MIRTKITQNSILKMIRIEGGKWYERNCNIGMMGGYQAIKKITQNSNLKMISIEEVRW